MCYGVIGGQIHKLRVYLIIKISEFAFVLDSEFSMNLIFKLACLKLTMKTNSCAV